MNFSAGCVQISVAGRLAVDQNSALGPAASATGTVARDIVRIVSSINGSTGNVGPDRPSSGSQRSWRPTSTSPMAPSGWGRAAG